MQRRPSTQDITWLLDLHQNKQLDLDPPYQRRSVWTRKDKQFFIDTIFRNFPSPAVFLHKTMTAEGKATYHVVDGKQRTQTILDFVADKVRVSSDYGDVRLSGKKWSDLQGEQELKQVFWNYQITVEMIDIIEGSIVNEVFDRLNRNSRKLSRQELRHAKYDGWLLAEVETEVAREEWKKLGISSTARAKRMSDSQSMSELMLVLLESKVLGFDQDTLDELYAKYDELPSDALPDVDPDQFAARFAENKEYILKMNESGGVVSRYARGGFGHFYTLWALLALSSNLPDATALAERYGAFMAQVQELADQDNLEEFLRGQPLGKYTTALRYFTNSRGASTDLNPRKERLEALKSALLG